MKLIKISFLIALLNFILVGSVVLALKKPNDTPNNLPTISLATPLSTEAPSPEPTIKTKQVNTTKNIVVDPFALIMNQPIVNTPQLENGTKNGWEVEYDLDYSKGTKVTLWS